MSGTPYPPTGYPAVLSAMGGLTSGFGMGPGDPPLHGSAHGRCSHEGARPAGPDGCMRVAATIGNVAVQHEMKSSGY